MANKLKKPVNVGSKNFENKISLLIKLKYIPRSADKSLARPGRKQATVTEDFEFHISHL